MRILFLDIETAPAEGWFWGANKQFIIPAMIKKGSYVLMWSAKWLGEDELMFDSVHESGEKGMLKRMHRLLDKADAVCHYYGRRFDMPMLNTEFVKHGMKPPSPYKQIDLKQVVADNFRLPSNKLEYVVRAFKIGRKIKEHIIFELWPEVMAGNDEANEKMKRYCKHDTALLEPLYIKVLPWIKNHPNYGAYQDNKLVCPSCGGTHLQRRGTTVANLKMYPQYRCMARSCGRWFRSNFAIPNKKIARYVGI